MKFKLPSRRWLWPLVGVYLIALAVLAPAGLIGWGFEFASKERILFSNTSGTVWSGAADLVSADKGNRIGRYRWRFLGAPLLTGTLQVAVDSGTQPTATISLTVRRLTIDRLVLQLPLEALAGVVPEIGKYGIDGKLTVTAENLALSLRSINGNLTGELAEIRSPITRMNTIGSYRISVVGHGEQGDVSVATLPGSGLLLGGGGKFTPPKHLTFNGSLTAAPEQRERISGLLAAVGGNGDRIPIVIGN